MESVFLMFCSFNDILFKSRVWGPVGWCQLEISCRYLWKSVCFAMVNHWTTRIGKCIGRSKLKIEYGERC